MTLKESRIHANLTQQQAAARFGISLRSYKSYENEARKAETLKYRYMQEQLEAANRLDETHGLLTVEEISSVCTAVFANYQIAYCYLFGSYAKGKATEISDVDLLISGEVKGLRFFGLVEDLRTALHKNVDLLTADQLLKNPDLLNEILQTGVKIYG